MHGSADAFDAVDRKLNVFALANGMDLTRQGEARVLGWYRDELERRVRVEPGAAGERTWAIRSEAATSGKGAQASAVRTLESALDPAAILDRFKELLAGAVDAANAIPRAELTDRA